MHLNDMEKETGRLQVIIREADADKRRQQKELDQVITERDILGTQLGKNSIFLLQNAFLPGFKISKNYNNFKYAEMMNWLYSTKR